MDLSRIALVVLAGLALLVAFRAFYRERRDRHLRIRRARRAHAGELAAEPFLEARGYRVVARQVRRRFRYEVDGQEASADVRADLVVERGGRRLVAEVKTGAHAPSLATAATRRQIFEYLLAFPEVDGALLVDADGGVVREVSLPRRRGGGWRATAFGICAGVAIGLAIALAHLG